MRRFYDDEREFLLRVMDESKEIVRSWKFEWFLSNVVFFFELISHLIYNHRQNKIKARQLFHFR